MAKQGIHPDYHKITVQMTDGTKYETRSTWGKEGDVMQLDVDPKTHPAWVGGVNLRKTGQMEKFTNKFSFLDVAKGNKATAKPTGEKSEKKEAKPAADKAPKAEKKDTAPKAKKAEKKDSE